MNRQVTSSTQLIHEGRGGRAGKMNKTTERGKKRQRGRGAEGSSRKARQ